MTLHMRTPSFGPQTKKPVEPDVAKSPSALKQKVAGLGFDEAEKALRPPQDQPDMGKPQGPTRPEKDAPKDAPKDDKPTVEPPKDDTQAQQTSGPKAPTEVERVKGAIAGATDTFKSENHEYQETYLEKHDRHHRNKAMKKDVRGDGSILHDDYKDQVAQKWEHSPETVRRTNNTELKPTVKADAQAQAEKEVPGGGKEQKDAYKRIKREQYMLQREYSGGDAKKQKYVAKIKTEQNDARIEAENAKLLADLKKKALTVTGLGLDVDKAYEGQRQKTSGDKKKEAKAEKEAQTLSLTEKLNPMKSDETKEKVARIEQAEKDKKAAKQKAKAQDKEFMAALETRLDKEEITWEQAASSMKLQGISDEKLRVKWNSKVKGKVDHSAYRTSKLHRATKGKELVQDGTVKQITTNLGHVTTGAGIGNKAALVGGKLAGDQVVTGSKVTTGGGQSVTMGGTANQATGIIGGVSSVVNAIGAADKIVGALGARDSEDGAEREKAKTDLLDGTVKLGSSAASGTASILKAVQAFTSDPAVAAAMRLDAVPIVGIIGASIKLVSACITLAGGAERLYKGGKIRKDAKSEGKTELVAALKGGRNADIQLVSSTTVDVITALASLVGNSITLGGVSAPAGAALTGLAAGVSAVKSLAVTVYESVEARAAKKAQVKYASAVKNGASDEELLKRGKHLITSNIKYALQVIINAAREGDPQALDYMRLFSLDTKDFNTMSNDNIRAAILVTIDKSDEPETMLDQLKNVPGKLRGGGNAFKKKVGMKDY